MTVPTRSALGVHPFGVHSGKCEKICENSLASWSAVAVTPLLGVGLLRTVNRRLKVQRRPKAVSRGLATAPQDASDNGTTTAKQQYYRIIQKLSKSHDSAAELSPTFRLDGGTVPLEKCRGRIQKSLIFEGSCGPNPMKNRTVLFDAQKNQFFHTFLAKMLRFFGN